MKVSALELFCPRCLSKLLLWQLTLCSVHRLASRVKRPIRTSWTLRVWSAPSRCRQGDDHTSSLDSFEKSFSTVVCKGHVMRCERGVSLFKKMFLLLLSSAPERDEWLEAITSAIGDYTRKKITFISGKSQDEVSPRNLVCFLLATHKPRFQLLTQF